MKCEVCSSEMELKLVRLLDGAKLRWQCPKCDFRKEAVWHSYGVSFVYGFNGCHK